MTYDERAQASAARQLAPKSQGGKGGLVTLTGEAVGTWNDDTQSYDAGVPTVQEGSGVALNYAIEDIDGTNIQASDIQLTLSPFKTDGSPLIEPTTGTIVELEDGRRFVARAVQPKRPAGVTIAYVLQLRGK